MDTHPGKTIEVYLPTLTTKVTDPETIFAYMTSLQQLAKKANIEYPNTTLDVGAALPAYKVLWSYPEKFSNVVVHLGDFHFMKENFKVNSKKIQINNSLSNNMTLSSTSILTSYIVRNMTIFNQT